VVSDRPDAALKRSPSKWPPKPWHTGNLAAFARRPSALHPPWHVVVVPRPNPPAPRTRSGCRPGAFRGFSFSHAPRPRPRKVASSFACCGVSSGGGAFAGGEPATRSAVAGAAAVRRLHLPEKRGGGRWCEGGKGIRGERHSMAECARSHLPNLQPITWPRRLRAHLGGQSARCQREDRCLVSLRAREAGSAEVPLRQACRWAACCQ